MRLFFDALFAAYLSSGTAVAGGVEGTSSGTGMAIGAASQTAITFAGGAVSWPGAAAAYPNAVLQNIGANPINVTISGQVVQFQPGQVLGCFLTSGSITNVATLTSGLTSTLQILQATTCPSGLSAGAPAGVPFGSLSSGTVPDPILPVYGAGVVTLTTNQVSVGSTATLIAAAATNNISQGIEIQNCGTVTVYVGGTSGVTTANGWAVPSPPPGATGQCNSKPFPYAGALYGIVASGSQSVGYARY